MAVELNPKGTYGARIPQVPGPLRGFLGGLSNLVFRLAGGRMRVQGLSLLRLTTVGAKSGKRRSAIVGWYPDGEGAWLIIASLAGAATHPAWSHNLAAHPDQVWIEVGKRTLRVRPEVLSGERRSDAWHRIGVAAPGYSAYQTKTDREIPIIRLVPAD